MIVLIATGGTIAQSPGPARLHLAGEDLASAAMKGIGTATTLETVDLFDLPSTYIEPEHMLKIAEKVESAASRDDVEGVVVTHGSATMEETAYFVDLLYGHRKPVVFTGALRRPGELGYDGSRNLADAVLVASSPAATDLGVLVVMNGEIHAARDVVKSDTSALGAFVSPNLGVLGRIWPGTVDFRYRVPRSLVLASPGTANLARVEMLYVYSGMRSDVVEALLAVGCSGIALGLMGGGGVPPTALAGLRLALNRGITIVAGTRCLAGRVVDGPLSHDRIEGYGRHLINLGVQFTPLAPLKARLKLMLCLSTGTTFVNS